MSVDNASSLITSAPSEIDVPLSPVPANQHRQPPLRIGYIGNGHGTSLQRARALERLGHTVTIIDPWAWLGYSKWMARWLRHTGGLGTGSLINRRLLEAVARVRPELIWVNQGEFIAPKIVRQLRRQGVPIVNYTNDNPFNARDNLRFHLYRKAVPFYDLLAVCFKENVIQAQAAGARDVIRVWITADEVAHRPRVPSLDLTTQYRSDVTFIGTWMPERGPFMAELIRYGVPLSIWGDRWQKAPEWSVIQPFWRGAGIFDEDRYAVALQSAKICLGLLSKENRNLHTGRSIQIPALGGLLLAERTVEHLAMYDEGVEAVFWRDAEECAVQCRRLLADEPLRLEIAKRGHERAKRNNLYNEPMLARLIERVMQTFKEQT